jgi:hypothetical protein
VRATNPSSPRTQGQQRLAMRLEQPRGARVLRLEKRLDRRVAGLHVGAPGQFTKVVMLLGGNEMENAFALTAIAGSRSNVAPAVVR